MVLNRGGAEEARGTHNPEVIGSKPISGTSPYRVHRSVWTLKTRRHEDKNQPGIAQRQSVYNIVCYYMTSNGLNCEWLSPYKRKVTGSKPVAGTSLYQVHRLVWTIPQFRNNAGLIIL